MIALKYCENLLKLYTLDFVIPNDQYIIDEEPSMPILDRHTTHHVRQIIWVPTQFDKRLSTSPISTIMTKTKYGEFDNYEPNIQSIISERDKSDDIYRLLAIQKKKEKRNLHYNQDNLPYNFVNSAKLINVKLYLSKKPLKDYHVYDSDGSIIRKREQIRQLNPIINVVKGKLLQKTEKQNIYETPQENISNQQAIFKSKVSTKVKMLYDQPYNFESFPLSKGVKLYYQQEKRKDSPKNDDEEDISDSDAYQLKNMRKSSIKGVPLAKLPSKLLIQQDRSFRNLKSKREYI